MTNKPDLERGPNLGRGRLLAGQVARLMIADADTAETRLVAETAALIEAPNWTPDGRWLIVNGDGRLRRIAADESSSLEEIDTGSVHDCNNEHVLSPDGSTISISAGGHLYPPADLGRRIQADFKHSRRSQKVQVFSACRFPDNKTLAYVAAEDSDGDPCERLNIAMIPSAGEPDRCLTDLRAPADGPEYSPYGRWIYYNCEQATLKPGHAQIFRVRPDGAGAQQLTFDERVNWFPHISPDG